jgi:hypothetical protein
VGRTLISRVDSYGVTVRRYAGAFEVDRAAGRCRDAIVILSWVHAE